MDTARGSKVAVVYLQFTAKDKKVDTKEIPIVTEAITNRNNEPDHDPAEQLKATFDLIHIVGRILGWQLSYDWKRGPRYWVTFLNNTFAWSQYVYTLYRYIVNGEYKRILEVLAICGITMSKIWIMTKSYKKITALHNFSYKIIRQAGKHMTVKLDNQQRANYKLSKVLALIFVSCLLIYGVNSVSRFILYGELIRLLPIDIMFLDQAIFSDFLIANAIMVFLGTWTCLVLMYMAMQFMMLILNCSIQVDLIEDDMRQLDEYWSDPKTTTMVQRHWLLRNICQKCQDKDEYMDKFKNIFDQPIFGYFCIAYISQIISLYEIKMEEWYSGLGIAGGVFVEMLLYCVLGTKSSTVNERLLNVLIQSKWYTYDIYSQKIFLNLLNSCMNGKELWIGPLAPLSVSTGVQVVKTIYSYYTILAEVA